MGGGGLVGVCGCFLFRVATKRPEKLTNQNWPQLENTQAWRNTHTQLRTGPGETTGNGRAFPFPSGLWPERRRTPESKLTHAPSRGGPSGCPLVSRCLSPEPAVRHPGRDGSVKLKNPTIPGRLKLEAGQGSAIPVLQTQLNHVIVVCFHDVHFAVVRCFEGLLSAGRSCDLA